MTKRRLKIWITRVQPAADVTAERVRAMGHDAVVVPLLEVQVLPDVDVDLRGVAALAFTSANGVRAFADKSGERGLKVFAVGAATALAARKAGFKSVLSADGDVLALGKALHRVATSFAARSCIPVRWSWRATFPALWRNTASRPGGSRFTRPCRRN